MDREQKVHARRLAWEFTPSEGPLAGTTQPFALDFAIDPCAVKASHQAIPTIAIPHEWPELVKARVPEIDALGDALAQMIAHLGPRDQANCVLALVQQTSTYRPDPTRSGTRSELVKCPVRTLVDGGGDCEDLAILAAAMLWRLGFRVALLFLPSSVKSHHCAVGITGLTRQGSPLTAFDDLAGEHYEYGELTSGPYLFGDVPVTLRGREPRIVAWVEQLVFS